MGLSNHLQQKFPTVDGVPENMRLPQIHQRVSLVDGELKTWAWSNQDHIVSDLDTAARWQPTAS